MVKTQGSTCTRARREFLFTNKKPVVTCWEMSRKRDYSKEAIKALVALHGTRKASRVSGIPYGTISKMAFQFRWKKATFTDGENEALTDAGDVIARELKENKRNSELNLSKYVAKASEKAAKHGDPLEVARKVRDVAGVFQVLYPPEEEGGLIEGAILIGTAQPTINTGEVEARSVPTEQVAARTIEDSDVRPELPDSRPEGD
jgi:hypothetical protein